MGAVAGGFVRHDGGGGLARQGRGGAAGRVDALLLLPAVAEPDADHLLLHVELLGHEQDLLRGRLLVLRGSGQWAGREGHVRWIRAEMDSGADKQDGRSALDGSTERCGSSGGEAEPKSE